MTVLSQKSWRCERCGALQTRADIRCGRCRRFDTLRPVKAEAAGGGLGVSRLGSGVGQSPPRLKTGIPGLDYVLGGGFVLGSSVFLLAPKGTGKSTLALVAAFWAAVRCKRPSLYIGGEETKAQICERCRRCKINPDWLLFSANLDAGQIDQMLAEYRPCLLVVDSVQKLTPTMKYDYAAWYHNYLALLKSLQRHDVPGLLVSQMNGDGGVMGGASVAHECDVIMELSCPSGNPRADCCRVLECRDKNRFHSLEKADLRMTSEGFV